MRIAGGGFTTHRGRGFASLLAVVIVAAACGQAETNAQASASSQSSGARPPANPGTAEDGPLVLEFDLPIEWTQPAGSADAVTGFRVGYFRSNDSTAIRTLDFERDALVVRDQTARVTLPRESIPGCVDCVVRVQTLSGGNSSPWSEPVRLAGPAAPQAQSTPQPPEPPRAVRAERPRNASPGQRRGGLAPGDIERHVALSESLRKLLPPDASIEAELRRFRRVDQLALAVAISRDYDIPFTTLSRTLEGPPRVSPRNALTKLRQDVDARGAIRKLRAEVRRLTDTPEVRQPPQ